MVTHRTVTRVAADTSGAAAILVALSMRIVTKGIGFAVDVWLWYPTERRLQSASVMAAFTAALESECPGTWEAIGSGAENARHAHQNVWAAVMAIVLCGSAA